MLVLAAAVGVLGAVLYRAGAGGRLVPDRARARAVHLPRALPVRLGSVEARLRQQPDRARAAGDLHDARRPDRVRRVRARRADEQGREDRRAALPELRRARARLDLVPQRDDRAVADRGCGARGPHGDPSEEHGAEAVTDLRRPPGQRLHAAGRELPRAGGRVDHVPLPAEALQGGARRLAVRGFRHQRARSRRTRASSTSTFCCRSRTRTTSRRSATAGGTSASTRPSRSRTRRASAGRSFRAGETSAGSRRCSRTTAGRRSTCCTRCCRTCRTSTSRQASGTACRRRCCAGSSTTAGSRPGPRCRPTSATCFRSSTPTALSG